MNGDIDPIIQQSRQIIASVRQNIINSRDSIARAIVRCEEVKARLATMAERNTRRNAARLT